MLRLRLPSFALALVVAPLSCSEPPTEPSDASGSGGQSASGGSSGSGGSTTAGVGGAGIGGVGGTAGTSAGSPPGGTGGTAGSLAVGGAGNGATSGAGVSAGTSGGSGVGAGGAAAGAGGVAGAAGANGGATSGGAGRGSAAGNAGTSGSGSGGANGGAAGASAGSGGESAGSGGKAGALCPATAAFCEDFEDNDLAGWTRVVTDGTLAISTARARNGTHSLLADVPANQRGGFIERTGAPLFPLPQKIMWGRMNVSFDGVSDGHTDFVRGARSGGGTPWYNLGEQHGEIMLNYYNGSSFDCWARPMPGKVIPQNTWMCWEWKFDGNTNEIQFFIDGQLSRRVDMTGDGCLSGQKSTWTAPDFAALRIGQYIAETRNTTARVYIDDIAVSTTERVGCVAP